jgi:peptide/nickel transport system substrate-binding protein
VKLATGTEMGYQGITLNVANGDKGNSPLGKDARVRRALELSIDRAALNQVVFNGLQTPNNQWVSPANPFYQAKFPMPGRDVAKARGRIPSLGNERAFPLTEF